MSYDKIESVSKVSETMKTQTADAMEQTSTDHFQSLVDSKSAIQTSFERIDPKSMAITQLESTQDVQHTPITTEDVSSEKTGSATDQEQKRQQQDDSSSDEVEGISGVGGAKRKGTSAVAEAGSQRSAGASQVNIDDLKNQTQGIVDKIDEAKSQLAQANQSGAEVKPSYQKLLRNHLNHIDDNVKIASSKLGIEQTPGLPGTDAKSSPLERFLDMLSRTQYEMNNINDTLATLSPDQMSPANMLSLQIKSNLISQEIELFTTLLNKALESTKTIMNVQV